MKDERLKLVHSGPIKQHRLLATAGECERRCKFLNSDIGKRYLRKWHRRFNFQKIRSALLLGYYGVGNE